MDDRAKQLADDLFWIMCDAVGNRVNMPAPQIFTAVIAALAPLFVRVERLEDVVKAHTTPATAPPPPVPQPGPTRGAEVAEPRFVSGTDRRDLTTSEIAALPLELRVCFHLQGWNVGAASMIQDVNSWARLMGLIRPDKDDMIQDARRLLAFVGGERAAAFTEAEAAVRSRREGQDQPEARWAIDAAAGEVRALRLREVP